MRARCATEQDSEHFGAELARSRPGREAFAVLYLAGELGSGKTTWARGFLRACGVSQPVRSPTYALLELYPVAGMTLVHVDLYRLRDPRELESLGLRDWARPGCLWLIEWPERAAGKLPAPDLTLAFTVGARGHGIEVTAGSTLGSAWLERLTALRRGRKVEKLPPTP